MLTALLALLLNQFTIHGQGLSDFSYGTDSTFEIVTWNIEWFPKSGMATVDSVQSILESADVDIWAIQEIDDTTLCRVMVNGIPGYQVYQDDTWFDGLVYIWKEDEIELDSVYRIYDTAPYWNAFPRSPLVLDFHRNNERWVLINNHFKCCGDGTLDQGNSWDEETRRLTASNLLEDYIDENLGDERVVMLGDLNDLLIDNPTDNVFIAFFDKPLHYRFVDLPIAAGSVDFWSYPGWPSHLDHILVTDEFFPEIDSGLIEVETLLPEEFMAGFWQYDAFVSDHRPVAMKIYEVQEDSVSSTYTDAAAQLEIMVWPNPSSDNFQFHFSAESLGAVLQIVDLTGRQLDEFQVQAPNMTWSAAAVEAGLYQAILSKPDMQSCRFQLLKVD